MDQAPLSATASQKLRSARCALIPIDRQSIGGNRRVHRAGTGTDNPFDDDALVLENAVKCAPGKSAVSSPALQSQIDRLVGLAALRSQCLRHATSLSRPLGGPAASRMLLKYMLRIA